MKSIFGLVLASDKIDAKRRRLFPKAGKAFGVNSSSITAPPVTVSSLINQFKSLGES